MIVYAVLPLIARRYLKYRPGTYPHLDTVRRVRFAREAGLGIIGHPRA
jgi:hypothetical protein